ncbi:MAG: OsmC family protein [Anaerolineae bacterium]|nr:OsmC family protein [Anaerolineae bacterium]
MDASVVWQGEMSFTGKADTGFEVPMGANPSVGGANDGFRPLELMAVSLAGCTAMDVISILKKKRMHVSDYEVKVHTEQADQHPMIMTSAVIEYHVSGNQVEEQAVLRAIELSALRYCPAQNMLAQIMPITLKYFIYEEDHEGRALIISGEWSASATMQQ